MIRRVCVFCGSSAGSEPQYIEAAQQLGLALLQQNMELVYGGADIGLMGAVANTVLDGGGKATGVIPRSFADKVSHSSLSELFIVESMHERKTMMFDLADGFIALPGGFGTLEEVFELLTWAQLGFHTKPLGLINVAGYYDGLLAFLEHSVNKGFIKQQHQRMLLVANDSAELLTRLADYTAAPSLEKWVQAQQ